MRRVQPPAQIDTVAFWTYSEWYRSVKRLRDKADIEVLNPKRMGTAERRYMRSFDPASGANASWYRRMLSSR